MFASSSPFSFFPVNTDMKGEMIYARENEQSDFHWIRKTRKWGRSHTREDREQRLSKDKHTKLQEGNHLQDCKHKKLGVIKRSKLTLHSWKFLSCHRGRWQLSRIPLLHKPSPGGDSSSLTLSLSLTLLNLTDSPSRLFPSSNLSQDRIGGEKSYHHPISFALFQRHWDRDFLYCVNTQKDISVTLMTIEEAGKVEKMWGDQSNGLFILDWLLLSLRLWSTPSTWGKKGREWGGNNGGCLRRSGFKEDRLGRGETRELTRRMIEKRKGRSFGS